MHIRGTLLMVAVGIIATIAFTPSPPPDETGHLHIEAVKAIKPLSDSGLPQERQELQTIDVTPAQAAPAPTPPTAPQDPRDIARAQVSADQWTCLDKLWTQESGWNPGAVNPSSGAYGIVQALPAEKMDSAGSDWRTNPATQIKWGLGYIQERYGSPCGAWQHETAYNWY